MTRLGNPPAHLVRALGCLFIVLSGALTAAPAQAEARSPGPGAAARIAGWAWPLAGLPRVVRGFLLPPEPWLPGHRGVDLRGSPGDAVLASGPGRVSFAGLVAGKPVVVITHAGGLRTTYEPVIAAVSTNNEVSRGSVIGRLSAAGSHCLPAACLHWGLRRGDTYLDPLALVGATQRVRLLPVWGRASPTISSVFISSVSATQATSFAAATPVGTLLRPRVGRGSRR